MRGGFAIMPHIPAPHIWKLAAKKEFENPAFPLFYLVISNHTQWEFKFRVDALKVMLENIGATSTKEKALAAHVFYPRWIPRLIAMWNPSG